jgi:hypothetical protein
MPKHVAILMYFYQWLMCCVGLCIPTKYNGMDNMNIKPLYLQNYIVRACRWHGGLSLRSQIFRTEYRPFYLKRKSCRLSWMEECVPRAGLETMAFRKVAAVTGAWILIWTVLTTGFCMRCTASLTSNFGRYTVLVQVSMGFLRPSVKVKVGIVPQLCHCNVDLLVNILRSYSTYLGQDLIW